MSETKQQKRHISKLWIVVAILFAVLIINQIPTGYYYSQPEKRRGCKSSLRLKDQVSMKKENFT